jgi:hypothetical protein
MDRVKQQDSTPQNDSTLDRKLLEILKKDRTWLKYELQCNVKTPAPLFPQNNLTFVIQMLIKIMSALFRYEFYTRMKRYWGENISIYHMCKLVFTILRLPGTFTRLRSCIAPAEIIEPPKISGGQNHKYDSR